jgi:eukaryotic-like serine/threonine-protein kinase
MNWTLGRYRLIAELGRGGMGNVYLAVVRGPGRFSKLVVLKQLRPDFIGDANFTAMFFEEARLAARLHHPNIVQTNEVVRDPQDGHFMVMEYLEGASLKRVIRRLRARGEASARSLYARAILDVLTALQYAHTLKDFDGKALNLVHRDVNPDNVFVLHTGEVKLLDFGIAKAADSTQETRVGMLKGKLHYMSPEQMAGDEIDCRGDLFAVGTMLWDALTGQRLWDGVKGLDIMTSLAQGSIPSPRSILPEISEDLERICMRALAIRPADRYADAASFRADLDVAFGGHVMGSAELATTMSAEFLEEQERMRALIAEQLQSLDDAPVNMPPGSAPQLPAPAGSTGVSIRSQTRNALAVQTEQPPSEPTPARRPVPLLAWIAGSLAAVGAVAAGIALRSHLAIVDTAAVPGAPPSPATLAPAAQSDTTTRPASLDDAGGGLLAAAPPEPPVDARQAARGRRIVRRGPLPAALAAHPYPVTERQGSGGAEGAGTQAPSTSVATPPLPLASDPPPSAPGPPPVPPQPPFTAAASSPPPVASGTIPPEAVNAVVRAHFDEIQRCFDRAQMDQLYLKVRVDMSAAIASDGHVTSVSTTATRDGTARLQACIRAAVQGWTFPPPAGGVSGRVSHAFNLE